MRTVAPRLPAAIIAARRCAAVVESVEESLVQEVLDRLRRGDRAAAGELVAAVYHELHAIARKQMASQNAGHTLQATALVNEAYLRLFAPGKDSLEWHDLAHFLRAAATAMRSTLIDHVRRNGAAKRTPPGARVALDELIDNLQSRGTDLLDLDDALQRLAELDPGLVQLVEMRYFGGYTLEQCARLLGISTSKAESWWKTARAWLSREIARG
jgi:RNA polymerase sigma factor (TIGR02999 family)